MKTKKWAVERTRTIQGLVDFIKKFLKLMASEQLVGAGLPGGPACSTCGGGGWEPAVARTSAHPGSKLSHLAGRLFQSRLWLLAGNLAYGH